MTARQVRGTARQARGAERPHVSPALISATTGTPDGPFTIVVTATASGPGVVASGWTSSADDALLRVRAANLKHILAGERSSLAAPGAEEAMRGVLDAAVAAVGAYYASAPGAARTLTDIPVALHGTDFQRAGWRVLQQIPPGHPVSYGDFAEMAGKAEAVRAAASVCARNAVGLFIPCHRVVRADASLGAFAWGLDVKRSLLEREIAH